MVVERVVRYQIDLVGKAAAFGAEAGGVVEPKIVVEQVQLQVLGRAGGEADGAEFRFWLSSTYSPRISPWNQVPQSLKP